MRTRNEMHADRLSVIQCINEYTQVLDLNHARSDLGESILHEIQQSKCIQSIATVQPNSFSEAPVAISLDGHLFGSISESVRQEVSKEINGSVGIQVDAKHLSPDDMEIYCEAQKHDISESLLEHINVDTDLLHYLEMYNELARRNENNPDVVEENVEENRRILDLYDSWSNEVYSNRAVLYGMAVADFACDGGTVDVESCKKILVEEINRDVKGTATSETTAQEMKEIEECLREMSSIVEDSNPQLKAVFEAAADILDDKDFAPEVG